MTAQADRESKSVNFDITDASQLCRLKVRTVIFFLRDGILRSTSLPSVNLNLRSEASNLEGRHSFSDNINDPSDIELGELPPPALPQPGLRVTRESARKREEKLRRLLEDIEMKFSHSIQFNAVPDWSSNYISYSNLKKLSVGGGGCVAMCLGILY